MRVTRQTSRCGGQSAADAAIARKTSTLTSDVVANMRCMAAGQRYELRPLVDLARGTAGAGPDPVNALTTQSAVFVGRTAPDWTGLPLRVVEQLGRHRALALLDTSPLADGRSGRDFQEEYLEWRVERKSGVITRVELTVELPERWFRLAGDEPEQALDVIAGFAGVPTLEPQAVYGPFDPFAGSATAAGRSAAFAATMLGPRHRNPLNDGRSAITCLTQRSNTLAALSALAAAALTPRFVRRPDRQPAIRSPTAGELMPLLGGAAQAGRGSDPVLVERFARLAFEKRTVAFAEPVGLWIQGVQRTRLRTPEGGEVPLEWFKFSRSLTSPDGGVEPSRPQRVCLEVPKEADLRVGDLIDVATGDNLRFGGQLAELVQIAMPLAVSPPGTAATGPPVELGLPRSPHPPPADDPVLCEAASTLLGESPP